MSRGMAGALAVGVMVALAGCGSGASIPAAGSNSASGAAHISSTTGGLCRSAYFPALQAAATAKLPVRTTAAAMTQVHAVGAAALGKALGVAVSASALPKAFADPATGADPLTVRPRAGGATWTFLVIGKTADLTVVATKLGGGALTAAKSFGPAWAGGAVQYTVAFPAGTLHPSPAPTLGAYLGQLAAATAAGKADLTVTAGGSPKPRPTQYQAYSGPVGLGALTTASSSSSLCGSWKAQTVLAYQQNAVSPVDAEMDDIGNGVSVGFAAGQFIVESVHAGVDAYTWYAVPGLPLPKG